MNLLVVSATEGEVGKLKTYLQEHKVQRHNVTLLVAGVGVIATTFAVTQELCRHRYDFVLQAGVGGSFDTGIPLGEVVHITSERYGDLGAEDHDSYIDIFDMGLIDADIPPHNHKLLSTPANAVTSSITLRQVSGLTVSTVSGSQRTIAMRRQLYNAQVESMEGAALHYACLQMDMPFAQVRGISNYVIPRDKSQWQMKDAIINLNNWLIDFITTLDM